MDKKQKISWGVSFGSLALVAGMVSYLGLSTGSKSNNQMALNQGQQPSHNTNQQTQDGFNPQQGQEAGQDYSNSWGEDRSSQFNQNEQAPYNHFDDGGQKLGNSNQQQDPFTGGRQSGHNRGFDTTTGGT